MEFLSSLKSYLHLQRDINLSTEEALNRKIHELYYLQQVNQLTKETLTSSQRGVVSTSHCNEEIIVSLTTYGKRLYEVYLAIESIMQGTIKPNRIILWISDEYVNYDLPQTLLLQKKRGLEIEYCKDIRSYTKLIPALKKYPRSSIITIDDDLIYPIDLVENLLSAHKKYEESVCANRVHLLPHDWGTNYIPLNQCDMYTGEMCQSHMFLAEGYAGVLYPPINYDDEMFNESVFLDVCKFADDVWFKAMELKSNIPVVYANVNRTIEEFLVNPKVQKRALKNINNGEQQMNDVQIKAVFEKYDLFNKMMAIS